jgi:AbiV family abortive infection protein
MENAQELLEDAELLLKNNRHARAFTLARIAREELIKLPLLLPVACELARNHEVNWNEIGRRLKDHVAKIRGSIFVDYLREPAQDGVYQASELSQQMSEAENLNALKNYSLYASQIGDEFFKPSEIISSQLAAACVSDAREQLQIVQMSYSAWYALTGMTEEGLRQCVETPVFQELFQALGNMTDLSHFPKVGKQQAMGEMTAMLNSPALQPWVALFPTAIEQVLQASNQGENLTPGNDPEDGRENLESTRHSN